MNLIFSQKWSKKMGKLAGKANYVIEKIWQGLPSNFFSKIIAAQAYAAKFDKYWDGYTEDKNFRPKIHALQAGAKWKEGMNIFPMILKYSRYGNFKPYKFQFTPTLICKGVQEIQICHICKSKGNAPCITNGKVLVDGKHLDIQEAEKLALNDGFPDIDAFFLCFNSDFKGQIIHWTDLRY